MLIRMCQVIFEVENLIVSLYFLLTQMGNFLYQKHFPVGLILFQKYKIFTAYGISKSTLGISNSSSSPYVCVCISVVM